MSKVMIIDEKRNTVVVEVNPQILKGLGVKPEDVKKHSSRRQLIFEMDAFIKN